MTIAGLKQVQLKRFRTGVGQTEPLELPRGVLVLYVDSDNWTGMSATLLLLRGSKTYPAVDTNNQPIVFTADRAVPILGGQKYILDVTSGTGTITADAVQAAREI